MAAVSAASLLAGAVMPPLTALLLVVLIPSMVAGAMARGSALEFLRRLALLLFQEGIRSGWRDSRLRTPRQILVALASLARSRAPRAGTAYLHRGDDGRLQWVGGFGLVPADLDEEALRTDHAFFARASTGSAEDAARSVVRRAGLALRALPVLGSGGLVGYWLLSWVAEEPPPDADEMDRLAAWVGPRVSLDAGTVKRPLLQRLRERVESDSAAVERLYREVMGQRREQSRAFQAIQLPVVVTDVTGRIQFANRALSRLLEGEGLSLCSSLRELIFLLAGEEELGSRMSRLFAGRETVRVEWVSANGLHFDVVMEPVGGRTDAADLEDAGFAAFFWELSEDVALVRARRDMAHFITTRARDSLMVISGYIGLLRARATAADDQEMLGVVARHADELTGAVKALQVTAATEQLSSDPIQLDCIALVQSVIAEVAPLAAAWGVSVRPDLPEVALPVLASPRDIHDAIKDVLREAIRRADRGSALEIGASQEGDVTRLVFSWSGSGLDPDLLELLRTQWRASPDELPEAVQPYARAGVAFGNLWVDARPGEGLAIAFSLARWVKQDEPA